MTAELSIEPVGRGQFEQLLPMIAAYQRFYEVEESDEGRNRPSSPASSPPATTACS